MHIAQITFWSFVAMRTYPDLTLPCDWGRMQFCCCMNCAHILPGLTWPLGPTKGLLAPGRSRREHQLYPGNHDQAGSINYILENIIKSYVSPAVMDAPVCHTGASITTGLILSIIKILKMKFLLVPDWLVQRNYDVACTCDLWYYCIDQILWDNKTSPSVDRVVFINYYG